MPKNVVTNNWNDLRKPIKTTKTTKADSPVCR
jgi:hypothetical protein